MLGTAITVVATKAPLGTQLAMRSDPVARIEFLEALARSETAWLVEYSFERTTGGGQVLSSSLTEARFGDVRVVSSAESLRVTVGRSVITCTRVDDQTKCLDGGGASKAPAVPSRAVYAAGIRSGAYVVTRAEDRHVAGERTRCYLLRSVLGVSVLGIGGEAEHCFTPDHIPMWSRVVRELATDVRVAVHVDRRVTSTEITTLLEPFDLDLAAIDR